MFEELNYIEFENIGKYNDPVLIDYVGEALGICLPYMGIVSRNEYPQVQITGPVDNSSVKDIIDIIGTVDDSDLKYYQLYYGEGESPLKWNILTTGSNIVNNAFISKWNTTDLNGVYTIKLVAVDRDGNLNADEIKVYLVNKSKGNNKFIATVSDNGRLMISRIFSNRSIGDFYQIDELSSYCRGITQEDIDDDGDDDIIFGNRISDNFGYIYIYLNNGNNTFNRLDIPFDKQIGYFLNDIAAGDFNNDGLKDIVFCGYYPALYCLENMGDYNFQIKDINVNATPYYVLGLETLYYDNDDKLDIIANGYPGSSSHNFEYIFIYTNKGNFQFNYKYQLLSTGKQSLGFVIDDFNKDNIQDIIIGGGSDGIGFIHKRNCEGGFELLKAQNMDNSINKKPNGYAFQYGNYSYVGLDSYKFNKVDTDLIIQSGGYVYILTNIIPGYFDENTAYKYYIGDYSYAIALPPKEMKNELFYPEAKISSPYHQYQPAMGLVPILGTANAVSFKNYKLEYGKGRNPLQWINIESNYSKVINSELGIFDTSQLNGIYTVRLTVYDNDNNFSIDEKAVDAVNPVINTNILIAMGRSYEFYSCILKDEELTNKKVIGVFPVLKGSLRRSFGIADFDQDGDYDIISGIGKGRSSTSGVSKWGFITLHIQHNDHSFTEIPIDVNDNIEFNKQLMDIAILDINNDLYPDFITSGNSKIPYLFINNQNNTFTIIQLTEAETYLGSKDGGDFNEDGFTDTAIADSGNNIYIYENDQHGGFIKLVPFQVASGAITGLASGDFNEDGHDDLIVCGSDGKFWLYAGDGYNNFNLIEQDQFPASNIAHVSPVVEMGSACSMDKIDINNDGHLDLIIQKMTGQIYFAYGTGRGTFSDLEYKEYSLNSSYEISVPYKFVDPDDIPVAEITRPGKGEMQTYTGQSIWGIATTKNVNDFQEYVLEYGYGESPDLWNVITSSTTPLPSEDRIVSFWDVNNLNGIYTLRLSVKSKKGYTAYDTVTVIITSKKQTNDKCIAVGQ